LLCNHFRIVANRREIAQRNHRETTAISLHIHFVVAAQKKWNRFEIAATRAAQPPRAIAAQYNNFMESLRHRSKIAQRNHCETAAISSSHNHFTIALQSMSNYLVTGHRTLFVCF
jgi:hypothetical protein